jgi:hypothetical protein
MKDIYYRYKSSNKAAENNQNFNINPNFYD